MQHTTVIFNFVMIWAMNPAKKIVKIILNGWILPKVKAAFMLIENVWGHFIPKHFGLLLNVAAIGEPLSLASK